MYHHRICCAAPSWEDIKAALLDILTSANSIEIRPLEMVSIRQANDESVSDYALHYCALFSWLQHGAARVARRSGVLRIAWVALTVALWQHGLHPSLGVLRCTRTTVSPSGSP